MGTAFEIFLFLVLLSTCAIGMIVTVLQLPGTWVILIASALHGWYYDWTGISLKAVLIMLGVAIAAEIGETASAAIMARRGGASRRAAWFGLLGGIVGALLLSVPVPLIGTLIGAAVGCFAGAFIAEMQQGRGVETGARSGWYSALGRTMGSLFKVAAAAAMGAIAIFGAIRGLAN